MTVVDLLPKLVATAQQLQAKSAANEANTKHHLVEPLLRVLGWNLDDFSEVDREYKVYDGTFLDYALRIDDKPKLFIEAKAIGKSLADKQFIAQTVNYANNEGVVWCVLTNGLAYQVYKSNEPVQMDRKLLFEVDILEVAEPAGHQAVADALNVLSRSNVQHGKLDEWGESVFVDIRVRSALAELGHDPTEGFVTAVADAIEGPKLDWLRLRASLSRILGDLAGPTSGALVGMPPVQPLHAAVAKTGHPVGLAAAKAQYAVEYHTKGKPAGIVDLFGQVDAYALAMGDDVERRPTKQYIGYFAGKRSFFTLEPKKQKIYAYISMPPADAKPWNADEMRDVSKIGHYGMGDTEFVLRTSEQIPRLKALLKDSYYRNRK